MHKSVLNNLERGGQLESYNDHDHNNDNNEPENQQLYYNHLEDSFYQKLRERSSSSGSYNRYNDNPIQIKKVNNLLQYSTLSCPAQRTNYTQENENDKTFHENIDDDENRLYPKISSSMKPMMIKENNIKADRHFEQRSISPKISASSTPHKRVHYDIENESRYMRFRSKSTEPTSYHSQRMESPRWRKNDIRRHVHYADTSYDDSSSYGYYRRYQSPSPVPTHYKGHRSRAERHRRR